MRISSDEALRRLNSPRNLVARASPSVVAETTTVDRVEHKGIQKPTRTGSPNVPEFLKDTMANLVSQPGAPNREVIGRAFGVSGRSVDYYKNGTNSNPASLERRAKVQERTEKIKDQALERLMKSLGIITDDKLEELDANQLGRFAADMGKVVKTLTPDSVQASNTAIVIYSPETRSEEKYKTIDI